MPTAFNPFDPDFLQDPYPTYAALREEAAVARIQIPWARVARFGVSAMAEQRRRGNLRLGSALRFMASRLRARRARTDAGGGPIHRPGLRSRLFTVSRFDEVSAVLRSPELFSSEVMGGSQAEPMNAEGDIAPTSGAIIAQDPPEHTRQRAIVNRGFTPRRIAALEPRIRAQAEELFSAFEGRGSCELMSEFANPLPVGVIADLLGLDPSRRDDFKRWATSLIVGSTRPGAEGFGSNVEMFREFRGYMTEVVEERRRSPGDDLVSVLIHAGEGEGILDAQQVISFASLMLAAGSETTTNLIGNALLALSQSPEQLARVQDDPKLIPGVVEEALRYDSPIQLVMRIATQDTELGGVAIRKGSIVAPLIASANRDERHFDDPDRFDVDRPTPAHLAFGFGNHFCIGASLARLEGSIALEMILTRLPGLEILSQGVERHGSFLVRGPTALPLRFEV